MHILPLLKPGVVVHVHEMFGSAEDRIHPDLAYNAGRGWTETEFLLAFLYKNPGVFRIFRSRPITKNENPWEGGGTPPHRGYAPSQPQLTY